MLHGSYAETTLTIFLPFCREDQVRKRVIQINWPCLFNNIRRSAPWKNIEYVVQSNGRCLGSLLDVVAPVRPPVGCGIRVLPSGRCGDEPAARSSSNILSLLRPTGFVP